LVDEQVDEPDTLPRQWKSLHEERMLAYLFIALAFGVRFLLAIPAINEVMNFTPLGAALLFFGATRKKEEWAPVVCLAIGVDFLLTTQVYHQPLRWDVFAPLAYYVIALFIGTLLKDGLHDRVSALKIAGASVAGSLVFFLTSNFVAWLAMPERYTRDIAGVVDCYVAAIPFFRNTFFGDLVYSFVMFGTPAVIAAMQRKKALAVVRH
jgi:hypothetical protein